jgi:hypothetical protein
MHKTSKTTPEAYIAVGRNKSRLKIYNGKDVFMKDAEEFQIELFNPTTQTVGVKILINGKSISNSLLVLKPGERSYLERYIDDNRKFLFDTYQVENSQEVKDAIRNNGDVKVEFYNERPLMTTGYTTYVYPYSTVTIGQPYWPYTTINCGTGTGTMLNTTGTSIVSNAVGNCTYTSGLSDCTTGNTATSSCYYSASSTDNNIQVSSTVSTTPLETGRIEMGGASQQSFGNYYGNFESFYFASMEYKILPESARPKEVKELRSYCPNCRTRIKKSSWKFCASCGEKL